MNNTIAHIVGLDEIHKKKLIKQLPNSIKIIDLDTIQQLVYNHNDIAKQKKIWADLSNQIIIKKKQKKIMTNNNGPTSNIDSDIKNLMAKRNQTKQNIHSIWRDKMDDNINKKISENNDCHIIFIGFNIFPKDYRIKIALPIPVLAIKTEKSRYFNKIIYDTKPNIYAANQIKYYLKMYPDRIIRGIFPLNLLNLEYLAAKYDKFTNFYYKQGYTLVDQNNMTQTISQLNNQLVNMDRISNKLIYVATLFKSGDIMPVNGKTQIEGFLTKDEAIENIKHKIKKPSPIYLYEMDPKQFHMLDGKLIATQELYPLNEESLMLSANK